VRRLWPWHDVGALATEGIPDLAFGVPVIARLIVLLRCEVSHQESRT